MGRWFEPSRGFVRVAQFGRAMTESFRLLPCCHTSKCRSVDILRYTRFHSWSRSPHDCCLAFEKQPQNAVGRRILRALYGDYVRTPPAARLSLLLLYNGCRSEEILH